MVTLTMKIGVDIDGVLGDGVGRLIQWAADKKDIHFAYDEVTKYDSVFDGKTVGELFAEAYADPDVVESVFPIIDSDMGFRNLRQRYDVVVITARPLYAKEATTQWFQKHFSGDHTILFSKDNGNTKGGYGVDVLIDDHVKPLEQAIGHGAIGILFDQPWNKDAVTQVAPAGRMYRATDWWQLVEEVGLLHDLWLRQIPRAV